jgi:hypothetical protein
MDFQLQCQSSEFVQRNNTNDISPQEAGLPFVPFIYLTTLSVRVMVGSLVNN